MQAKEAIKRLMNCTNPSGRQQKHEDGADQQFGKFLKRKIVLASSPASKGLEDQSSRILSLVNKNPS